MWDFNIGHALGLMMRTLPFVLLRAAVYFGIALAYVLATGTGVGVGWGMGAFGGSDFVKERFVQASVLFALDQLVKGVIRAITGLARGVLSILPLPGIKQLMGIVQAFLRIAVGLIDEVILAHAIRSRSTDAWGSAREALVLYAQNWKAMLKNAAWLTLFVYGLSFIVFLVMLAPAAALVYAMPGAWSAGGFVFALLFAWSIKAAFIEPFAIICMMQVYFKTIEGQQPNPDWDGRLDQMSSHFRKIKARMTGTPSDKVAPAGAQA